MVALVFLALLLTWAYVAVAALTVCLNETPSLADESRQDVPWAESTAEKLLPLVQVFGVDARSVPATCESSAPARAMGVAGLTYFAGILILDRARLARRFAWMVTIATGIVVQLALFFMPALLSSDVIDYASHGRVASIHHANPYLAVPAQFVGDAYSTIGAWPTVPTVYGPLWTNIDAAVTGLLANAPLIDVIYTYKALALFSDMCSAALIVYIVARWRQLKITTAVPVVAGAMWLWNPLVNVELVGNGHNDAVMILLVLSAFALMTLGVAHTRHIWLWAGAMLMLWLATLTKFVPAAIEAIVALVSIRGVRTPRARLLCFALMLGGVAAVTLALSWPWLDSPSVSQPLLGIATGGQRVKDAWQDAAAAWLTVRVVPKLGVPDYPATLRMDIAREIVWGVTRVIFLAYLAAEGWLLWKHAEANAAQTLLAVACASVRVLLLAVLLYISQVYAWYFLWPLPIACLLGLRDRSSAAAVIFGLAFLPAYYLREFDSYGVFYVPIYAVIGLAIILAVWSWQSTSPELAPQP